MGASTASHSTRRVGKSQNNAIACRRETHPRRRWEPRDFMRSVSLILGTMRISVNQAHTTHPHGSPFTMRRARPITRVVTAMQVVGVLGVVAGRSTGQALPSSDIGPVPCSFLACLGHNRQCLSQGSISEAAHTDIC